MSPRPRRPCDLCENPRTHDPPLWIRQKNPVCETCYDDYHDTLPTARRRGVSPYRLLRLRRRYFAYETCASDAAAATYLGITHAAYTKWRQTQNLPAIASWRQDSPYRTGDDVDHDARYLTWEMGYGDAAAARLLDLHYQAYRSWRYREGLPANTDRPLPSGPREVLADALGVDPEAIPC